MSAVKSTPEQASIETRSVKLDFDRDTGLTLWIISTYDHSAGVSKYDGCQALEINMSDVGVLEYCPGKRERSDPT